MELLYRKSKNIGSKFKKVKLKSSDMRFATKRLSVALWSNPNLFLALLS